MTQDQRIAGATIAAKSTLALARVVARSFTKHHPAVPFYVLLADEVDGYFDPSREPYELFQLDDLDIPDVVRFRFVHPQQRLSYAATPYLIALLLQLGYERVLFIKQESLVLGALDDLVRELPPGGVAVTPHLLTPLEGAGAEERELNILLSGVYNAGFVGVAAGGPAEQVMAWWQDRVFTHCRHAVADGMHYEQRWLDLAPAYFDNISIIREPGVNVAHWNLPERLQALGGCRLFRFSGYDVERPSFATRYSDRLRMDDIPDAAGIYDQYRRALLANGASEVSAWPYAYGRFDNNVPIPDVARDIYAVIENAAAFGDPFSTNDAASFYEWLRSPAEGGRVTNLWLQIHTRRPDLQLAFREPLARDCSAFLSWAETTGGDEHRLPPELR
jgi:hypothetical protein